MEFINGWNYPMMLYAHLLKNQWKKKNTYENTHTHTHTFFEVVTSNWAFQDSEKEQVEQFCSRLYLLISRWRMFLIFCTVISGGTIQPKKKKLWCPFNFSVSSTAASLQCSSNTPFKSHEVLRGISVGIEWTWSRGRMYLKCIAMKERGCVRE